jgi:L-gulono-1,4-lactone dehydrogenase
MPRNPQFWHNWVGNQDAVANLHRPRTCEELQSTVRAAATRGKIRPVGNSYAWSPLIPTGDTLIALTHLKNVLAIDAGGPEPSITVEAGISMKELTRIASQQGLTLISPTIFPRVSIGGVVNTGSHGTGRGVRTFSDDALALTFVRPDGELWTVRRGDPAWPAAAVGLGAFGPLYSVQLRAERAFNVSVEEKRFPVETMLRGIVDAVNTHEYVEMYWFPYDDDMWLMAIDRTDLPRDWPSVADLVRTGVDSALAYAAGYVFIPLIARHAPRLTPAMMKIAPSFQFREGVTVEPSALEFHYVTAYPMMYDMEYAVPLVDAARAWQIGIDMVRDYGARGRYPVNFVLHARYIRASEALMSPAHHRDPDTIMCMIECVTAIGTPGRDEFYARLAAAWADEVGGRPHWGKMLYHPQRLKADYGADMAAFEAVRAAHDPDRVFLNRYLEREVLQLAP